LVAVRLLQFHQEMQMETATEILSMHPLPGILLFVQKI